MIGSGRADSTDKVHDDVDDNASSPVLTNNVQSATKAFVQDPGERNDVLVSTCNVGGAVALETLSAEMLIHRRDFVVKDGLKR